MRVGKEPLGQSGQVRRHKGHRLGSTAAEEALIATVAGRMLRRRALVVDMNAKLGRLAEKRPQFGCDRRVVGAGEGGRRHGGRRCCGEKLNDKRERDEESGERRASYPGAEPSPARLPSRFGAPADHDVPLLLEITIPER